MYVCSDMVQMVVYDMVYDNIYYIIVSASRIPPRPLEALRLRCLVAQFDERQLSTTDGTCGWRFAGFERPLRLGGPLSCLCLSSWASRDLLAGLW